MSLLCHEGAAAHSPLARASMSSSPWQRVVRCRLDRQRFARGSSQKSLERVAELGPANSAAENRVSPAATVRLASGGRATGGAVTPTFFQPPSRKCRERSGKNAANEAREALLRRLDSPASRKSVLP